MPVHLSGLPTILSMLSMMFALLKEVQSQHKHRVEAVLTPAGVRVVIFSWGPPAKELLCVLAVKKPLLNWFFRAQLRVAASLRCQKTATTELNWFFASLTQSHH